MKNKSCIEAKMTFAFAKVFFVSKLNKFSWYDMIIYMQFSQESNKNMKS